MSATRGWASQKIRVRFRLTARRVGTQVEQVYLSLAAQSGEPPKRLVGSSRVALGPRQSREVEVDVDSRSPDHPLSYWDASAQRCLTPRGTFVVSLGSSVDNVEETASFVNHGSRPVRDRR